MAAVPKELRFLMFGRGPKFHAMAAIVLEVLGLACLILGIIGSVIDEGLGLWWPTDWIFIAIALWVWALWSWFTAYFGAKEE
jgi:hypothetical protein